MSSWPRNILGTSARDIVVTYGINILEVPWWLNQMETFSTGPFLRGTRLSPVDSPYKGQLRGALMFFYLRLNKRLSKPRCHRAHHARKALLLYFHLCQPYVYGRKSWWRHQMETFSALLVPGEFPTQRPVTRSFDIFFDLRPNKRLSKQSWGWRFETLSRPLWRRCNVDQRNVPYLCLSYCLLQRHIKYIKHVRIDSNLSDIIIIVHSVDSSLVHSSYI